MDPEERRKKFEEKIESLKEMREELSKKEIEYFNSITKIAARVGLSIRVIIELLKFNPNNAYRCLQFMSSYKNRVGLLENSIIANPIYIKTNNDDAKEFTSRPGEWYGFDFEREWGRFPGPPFKLGSIITILPDYLEDNDPDILTPIGSVDPISLEGLMFRDMKPISDIENYGLVRRVTYANALSNAGIERSDFGLNEEILEKEIYQVTPKGNGLLYLAKKGGDKNPRKRNEEKLTDFGGLVPVKN